MDSVSKKQRSINMSHIRGTNTSLEIKVRKVLFGHGFRYRINDRKLPGKPDIVLKKYKTSIFVNGCFWHHHKNCKLAYVPKTNTEYWMSKFDRNIKNDNRSIHRLRKMGYHVITVWECKLNEDFNKEMKRIINLLHVFLERDKTRTKTKDQQ